MKENDSIKFVSKLIKETKERSIRWNSISKDKFNTYFTDFKYKLESYSRNNRKKQSEDVGFPYNELIKSANAAMTAVNKYYSSNKETNIFSAEVSGVSVFLIESIDYSYTFPKSSYTLRLIKDVPETKMCFFYDLEFKNEVEKNTCLSELAEVISPFDFEERSKNMAKDFIRGFLND